MRENLFAQKIHHKPRIETETHLTLINNLQADVKWKRGHVVTNNGNLNFGREQNYANKWMDVCATELVWENVWIFFLIFAI